jgi:thiosulfate/3-mercaptopyruvate sulfurtransferase
MTSILRRHLVRAEELAAHLRDPHWAVFDCRFSLADPGWGPRVYSEGHIPGARYAHLDQDISGPVGPASGRHPLPDPGRLADWLGRSGVGPGTQVVAYDDAGGGFAVRLWWLLRWLGHEAVAVLDGGLAAWLSAGGGLARDTPEPRPRRFRGVARPGAWIDSAALASHLASLQVIDARAPERFRGEVEPIDPVAGHIPGAINLPMSGNLDAVGRFLPPDLLRARFAAALGGTPPERVVHSCGSGVNACHNLLAMELAGLSGSRLYAGSWSEWIRDPARPVATGD